jgi:hypothetical protein
MKLFWVMIVIGSLCGNSPSNDFIHGFACHWFFGEETKGGISGIMSTF